MVKLWVLTKYKRKSRDNIIFLNFKYEKFHTIKTHFWIIKFLEIIKCFNSINYNCSKYKFIKIHSCINLDFDIRLIFQLNDNIKFYSKITLLNLALIKKIKN